MNTAIGKSVIRKEALEKVTGQAKYTDDLPTTGFYSARLLTSPYAHARILNIDVSKAWKVKGVKAVITGIDVPQLFGVLVMDRPALAKDKVRYAGEPVAIVVAADEWAAEQAAERVKIDYEPLPVLLKPSESIAPDAVLIHEQVNGYRKLKPDVIPKIGTNIASCYRIRKGDAQAVLDGCDFVVQQRYYLPPTDHLAMEVRTARAQINADGTVIITTSSQAPYAVREQMAEALGIPAGQIQVKVPFIGGGFGGKAPVMLEILAYIASKIAGGFPVRLTIPREKDIQSAPCRIGMEADIKLGASKDGVINAAQMTFWLDCGAYADISPNMAKATAVDCTGPYNIENISCDSYCVYTNHTYATSYRSFSHESFTFCTERTIDMLAQKCGIDPLEFRYINAIRPGNKTPTQVECTPGIIGDLPQCIEKLKRLSGWQGGSPQQIKPDTVRVMGAACLWKTENPPTDAISGALITFNPDGSLNLNTGVVEMGAAEKTHLAQMLAEKLKIDVGQIHVVMPVDTMLCPEHWKTVASLTEYMTGHAVVRAADDIIAQLKSNGAQAFCCDVGDIEVANGRVFKKQSPELYIEFKSIVEGYKSPNGESIGEPVLGRGGFILKGLSLLNPETGQGRPGPAWTVGTQVVEAEVNTKTFTYRIISASTVIDVGKVINPEIMRTMVAGGMAMGASLASREVFSFDDKGVLQTPNLRTYKLMHIGQEPDYRVDFVETPEDDSPFGVRCYSEHGIIGIPAALANALSAAIGRQITQLPLKPEYLWRLGTNDSV